MLRERLVTGIASVTPLHAVTGSVAPLHAVTASVAPLHAVTASVAPLHAVTVVIGIAPLLAMTVMTGIAASRQASLAVLAMTCGALFTLTRSMLAAMPDGLA